MLLRIQLQIYSIFDPQHDEAAACALMFEIRIIRAGNRFTQQSENRLCHATDRPPEPRPTFTRDKAFL